MIKRSQEMDAFLKKYVVMHLLDEKSCPLDRKYLYSTLMNYDLTPDELENRNIDSVFSKFLSHYQNNSNLQVFHSDLQPRFLQFRNYQGEKHVKLYLSFPRDKVESCVEKIFDFISNQRIPTCSKVADVLRSDMVVLRMENADDAKKVIDFVNQDIELSSSAKRTNPFLYREGVVGVSYDDSLSFNTNLTVVLEYYFRSAKSHGELDQVSIEHFRNYVNQFYLEVFRNPKKLQEVFLSNIVGGRGKSRGEVSLNYEETIRILLMQLNDSMTFDDYKKFHLGVLDENKNRELVKYYEELSIASPRKKEQNVDIMLIDLLNSYIDFARSKYGDYRVSEFLKMYAGGERNAITRDNNFRDRFSKYLSPSLLLSITGSDITLYVTSYLQNKRKVRKNDLTSNRVQPQNSHQDYYDSLYVLLNEYVDIAILKYGSGNVSRYLEAYLTGNTNAITRDNNLRKRFNTYLPPALLGYITDFNVSQYVEQYIQNNKNNSHPVGRR